MLRDFNPQTLHEAREHGRLANALMEGTALRATLPEIVLPGLPADFATSMAFLEVTGQPSIAVGFQLDVGGGADAESGATFEAALQISRDNVGLTEFGIYAVAEGTWKDAFGLPGIDLERTALVFSYDTVQNLSFGVSAELSVGSRDIQIGGSVSFHAVTGVLTDVLFVGQLSAIGSADLIAFTNTIMVGTNPGTAPIDGDELLDFEIRDLLFSYAPLGGDETVGIEDGITVGGSLYAAGQLLGSVRGHFDASGDFPVLEFDASVPQFEFGALSVQNVQVDIRLSHLGDSHFIVAGTAHLFGTSLSIDVHLGSSQLSFASMLQVPGLGLAEVAFSSPTEGNPVWTFQAHVRNDLSATLEDVVAGNLEAWANQTEAGLESAMATLQAVQAEVNRLDYAIADARQRAQAQYDHLSSELFAAANTVASARHTVNLARYHTDVAYHNWQAAIEDTSNAWWWEKPYYIALETAAFFEYGAKLVAFEVANQTLIAAENILRGLSVGSEWVLQGIGPDAHPEVIALQAQKAIANVALDVAIGVIEATEVVSTGALRITAWVAENIDELFFVDEVSISGTLGGSFAETGIDLMVSYRVLGESHEFAFAGSLGDLESSPLTTRLVSTIQTII